MAGVVSECGARTLLIESLEALQQVEYSLCCGLVLVALGKPPAPGDLLLDVISALKQKGFRTITYEDGAQDWAVGIRCRVLLAGAVSLLDSSTVEFIASLRNLVQQFIQAETQRTEEKQKITNTMKEVGAVGESQVMVTLFQRIIRVSTLCDVPVLIAGETGTGKELVARAIHRLDPKRCHAPFVALNCGAISPALAESELFGHRRGAFTGADQYRKGLIRSAQGGVLFLDEIGEMELSLQTKLLRVLQECRVLGVGEEQEAHVDFRLLAASNRDLEEMVRQKNFRADLFHRLNVLSIHVPPLRERREDILPLIHHFLDKYRSFGCTSVHPDFAEALLQLELPGNAREVENLVRSALVNRPDDSPLRLGDLPIRVWQELTDSSPRKPVQAWSEEAEPGKAESGGPFEPGAANLMHLLESNGWHLDQSLDYCERVLLEGALHMAHGNQAKAARILGITPRSVYNKLRKHHLQHRKSA